MKIILDTDTATIIIRRIGEQTKTVAAAEVRTYQGLVDEVSALSAPSKKELAEKKLALEASLAKVQETKDDLTAKLAEVTEAIASK